jgi:thymidylate synthase
MIDRQYLDLIEDIYHSGSVVKTRNGIVNKIFHRTLTFDSTPLISVRKIAWQNAIIEFEWFLSGSDKLEDLNPKVHHWWKPWVNKSGRILNSYSKQFRKFDGTYNTIDQIRYLQQLLKNDPQSRRMVITTWNTADMAHAATPITNCHGSLITADVNPETNSLNLSIVQRSADVMLGLPHNLIQYWAFMLYLAKGTNLNTGMMYYTVENAHIYEQHMQTAHECINYSIQSVVTPTLTYSPSSDTFKHEDFKLQGNYNPILTKRLELIV